MRIENIQRMAHDILEKGSIRKIFLLSGLHKMVKIEEGGEEE